MASDGTQRTGLRWVVCLSLAAAAGLHLAVLPGHLAEGRLIATFFVITAALQLAAAALVSTTPTNRTYRTVALGNAAVICVWLISRSVGIPFGPGAGTPEPVALLDSLATISEVVAIVGLVALTRERREFATSRRSPAARVAAIVLTASTFAGGGVAVAEPTHSHGDQEHNPPARSYGVDEHGGHPCDLFHPCEDAEGGG